jgi:ABC-2 type transport system permease protein
MPFCCVFYPVDVLPGALQPVAWVLPPTYVFEGLRAILLQNVFRFDLMLGALALNAALMTGACLAFLAFLESARQSGSLLSVGE